MVELVSVNPGAAWDQRISIDNMLTGCMPTEH